MTPRYEIELAARERVKKLRPGEAVTNICAGNGNPGKYTRFMGYVVNGYTNKFGIRHESHYAKCSANGKTSLTSVSVIYPGTLSDEECDKLYTPVWEAEFGKKRTA